MSIQWRKHIRWRKWKYGSAASYFVTICCKDHQEFLGEITDCNMHKNELGHIVEKEWLLSKDIRPDMNITLGEYVVMPDHFHGIITIGKNPFNLLDQRKYGPQRKNLPSIIRGFKGAVTRYANKHNITFRWQSKYHDRVIRSRREYNNISKYIRNNPSNWKKSTFRDKYRCKCKIKI